ncbi:MAG: ABC transporter substrate-binding protein [Miniphocaeibacter sp.]|uniref:ABC transporter substrate-binding protein n=1 Tax=Miniphocaeibacter sp. TaxID=3100973 RepID=UPI001811048F|nr:ABC transporter substrate-binding protein [Gallicola sp.]
MNFKKFFIFFIILTTLLTSCSNRKDSKDIKATANYKINTKTITDINNRNVQIPKNINSLICVGVGGLRFTTYMDSVDLVVGVEKNEVDLNIQKPYNYINNKKFSSLPIIGDNGTTYDEAIVNLNPDIIIASLDGSTADKLQQKLNIPVVTIPIVDNIFDNSCYKTIELLGDIYNKEDRAKDLTDYIKSLQRDLDNRTKNIPEDEKPSVYVGGISFKGLHGFDGTEANYSPLLAINTNSLADLTDEKGPFNIDLEQVLNWDPDILFLDINGMKLINEQYQSNPDYFNSLKAVQNNDVYSQISFRFSAINVELAFVNAYYIGKIIYPNKFEDIDPIKKADEIFEKILGVKYYDNLKNNNYELKELKIGD